MTPERLYNLARQVWPTGANRADWDRVTGSQRDDWTKLAALITEAENDD